MRTDRSRPQWTAWWVTACTVAIHVMWTVDVWARAGGGGGFCGGGGGGGGGGGFSGGGGGGFSSGGSYGGGGGGPADPVVVVIFFVLIIGVGAASIVGGFLGNKDEETDDRPTYATRRTGHLDNIAKLQRTDPNFDFDEFAHRVEHAFLEIQDAWCAQDMEPVRAYVSDSILERFSLQIGEQIREGYHDHMTDIDVDRDKMRLAGLTRTSHFDVVDIYISCDAVDIRVSLETGKPLAPRSPIEQLSSWVDGQTMTDAAMDFESDDFVEYWSFLRRRGVQSQGGSGLIEGNCPNCGSELELNQIGACDACGAVLRGGEHDWVLAEITQASEWRPPQTSPERLASIKRFRAERDPGFTTQHAEDRGSVIFWRKAMADRTGSIDPLRKMATDELCDRLANEMVEADASTGREFWHDCSVGSVDCLGIVSDKDTDYLLLTIHSSGNLHLVLSNGELVDRDQWSRLRMLFVLKRNSGVTSRVERTISSAHCPSCGAPETDITSHTCEFCNEVVNDGRHDWVLHDIGHTYSETARTWTKRLEQQDSQAASAAATTDSEPPVPSNADALAGVIRTVAADKTLSPEEKKAVLRLGKKHDVPVKTLQSMLSLAVKGELDAPPPPDDTATRRWLTLIADAALSDGQLDASEEDVLMRLGDYAELSNYDIKLLLAKRRTHLFASRQRRT